MAVSLRVPGKFKLKRSNYKRGRKKNQELCKDLQEFTFDDDTSDDEINYNETSLSNKLRKRETRADTSEIVQPPKYPKRRKEFINYEVQSSDSLQSISLRFGCQVAELKQANKLINDQDFYAHRSIQIPVPENGVLSEELKQLRDESRETVDSVVNLSIGQMISDDSSTAAQSFLQAMDKDIQHIVESTQSHVHSEEEVLTMPRFHTMASPMLKHNDGSNCGINWHCLIIVVILIAVVPFILYGLYETFA